VGDPEVIDTRRTRRTSRVVFSLPVRAKAIALTIDDGPDAAETPAILDVLARHGANATFFLVGAHVAGCESLLERMRAESHEVANHTFRVRPSVFLSPREFEDELRRTHALIQPYGTVRWFRPGSGVFTPRMLRTAATLGYDTALASLYSLDHLIRSPRFHAWCMLHHARSGSVFVLHDGLGRGLRTAAALEIALPLLRERGVRVVTLSQLEALSEAAA
jgi:peptidoglycan/xylan/chitin deacetylase (PgdA/CDA1 family)